MIIPQDFNCRIVQTSKTYTFPGKSRRSTNCRLQYDEVSRNEYNHNMSHVQSD